MHTGCPIACCGLRCRYHTVTDKLYVLFATLCLGLGLTSSTCNLDTSVSGAATVFVRWSTQRNFKMTLCFACITCTQREGERERNTCANAHSEKERERETHAQTLQHADRAVLTRCCVMFLSAARWSRAEVLGGVVLHLRHAHHGCCYWRASRAYLAHTHIHTYAHGETHVCVHTHSHAYMHSHPHIDAAHWRADSCCGLGTRACCATGTISFARGPLAL